jgi:hypothetical protein
MDSRSPAEGARSRAAEGRARDAARRLAAVVALALLAVAMLGQANALRGATAFARFLRLKGAARAAHEAGNVEAQEAALRAASAEAGVVTRFGRDDADALLTLSMTWASWSARRELDPVLRLRLGEKAVAAAALAVRAAPSDYLPWYWLARTQAAIGLTGKAQAALSRARELAPPGMELEIVPDAD